MSGNTKLCSIAWGFHLFQPRTALFAVKRYIVRGDIFSVSPTPGERRKTQKNTWSEFDDSDTSNNYFYPVNISLRLHSPSKPASEIQKPLLLPLKNSSHLHVIHHVHTTCLLPQTPLPTCNIGYSDRLSSQIVLLRAMVGYFSGGSFFHGTYPGFRCQSFAAVEQVQTMTFDASGDCFAAFTSSSQILIAILLIGLGICTLLELLHRHSLPYDLDSMILIRIWVLVSYDGG